MGMFLLGFLTMAAFATIAALCFDQGREGLGMFFSGVVTWVILAGCCLYHQVQYHLEYKDVRTLITDDHGAIWYIRPNKADQYIEKHQDCELAYWQTSENEGWDVSLWNKKWVSYGMGNVRYAPKAIWEKYRPVSERSH